MKSMNQPKVEVAAALIWNKGKILITKRKKGSHLENFWEFPGGKLKEGESPECCLIREVLEELGIAIQINHLFWKTHFRYPEREVDLNFYSCDWTGGEPKAVGCDSFKWVEPKKLPEYSFPPANKELIEKLNE